MSKFDWKEAARQVTYWTLFALGAIYIIWYFITKT